MKIKQFDYLKENAKKIKNEIVVIYYAYHNPKVKLFPKILIFITLGYVLSPVDFVPDFVPVLGYLDDIIIVPLLLTLSLKLIPTEVIEESRIKATRNPLSLKKNWFFAILFICVVGYSINFCYYKSF